GLADQLQAQLRQGRDDTLRAMLIASLVALGVIGVAAGGFGWLLAGRALRPLQDITATARRVADGSLHERIALDSPHHEVKDLADIARHLTAEARGGAHTATFDLRTRLRPALVTGDPVLLERLTHNLLDNAIRYNLPDHGEVTVTTDMIDGHAQLTVDNTGPP